MTALILPRRLQAQPQGTIELDPSWEQSVFFAQVGPRIYANGAWSDFTQTSVQTLTASPFGVAINTTGESTPDAIAVTAGTTFQEWSLAYVLELESGSADSAFAFASTAAAYVGGTANSGTVSIIPASLTGHATFSGTDARPSTGAAVATFSASQSLGLLYMDGSMLAGTTHTYAGSAAPQYAVIGGRYAQANRNWRGRNHLTVGFNRALTPGEAQALSENPWQIFRSEPRRLYFDLGAGGGFTDTVLSASGVASPSLVGRAIAKSALSSAGAGLLSATGQAINQSSLSAAGSATASAVGQALFSATVTASGVAAATFGGQAISVGALASAGAATGAWAAQSLATSTISVSGIASASFVPLVGGVVDAAMASAGVATGSFTARAIATGALSASCAASLSWVSLVTGYADATFAIAGSAVASLAAQAVAKASASVSGAATAAFGGQVLRQGALASSGSAAAAWTGKVIAGAALSASGAAAATFAAKYVVQASLFAAGTSSINWLHDGEDPAIAQLLRTASVFARITTTQTFNRIESTQTYARVETPIYYTRH